MRTHNALAMLIFLIRCVTFSTLLAGVSSADNSSIFTNTNNIIAGNMPATFDLRPLECENLAKHDNSGESTFINGLFGSELFYHFLEWYG